MMNRDERTTYVASKKFYVNVDGRRRKVNPKKGRFDGTVGDHRLEEETVINGYPFLPGQYPFVFWGVPIFDKKDNPIENNGGSPSDTSSSDNSQPAPDRSPGSDPAPLPDSSPSYDSGSSGGYDGGSDGGSSSGGSDGGGGGGD